jgi:uncharacterized protein
METMMSKVYFSGYDQKESVLERGAKAERLLVELVQKEGFQLGEKLSLKVHFGEKGNTTFVPPAYFAGVIDYLAKHDVKSSFMETNVLYRGARTRRDEHIATALEHGFDSLPIEIADGEHGEDYTDISINQKHFQSCKIGKLIAQEEQMIVLSHFKGHGLAGFGGALKQLAMGCASRGGKLDQHANSAPVLNPLQCTQCRTCVQHCPADALRIGSVSSIDKKKCIGCAACIAVCPVGAIKINWLGSIAKNFNERMAEYALAAALGKKHLYLTFAINITKDCDCLGKSMKPIVEDLGVFCSLDPVAIDQACLDQLDKRAGKSVFGKGRHALQYAEQIGLGSREYELVRIA